MTVVEALAERLWEAGVSRAWGMPGGDSLPLLDALRERGIEHTLVRDETSAAFAADATAQLTGAPGLCVATLGPGMTNLLTGVTGCLLDRAPVIAVTSRYRTDRRATYTHMMCDQAALARATGKAHYLLDPGGAANQIERALVTATAPRPGPVWLEIPTQHATSPTPPGPGRQRLPPPVPQPPARLVQRLNRWTRPAILCGFAGRHADVQSLADALRAPVLTTYKAKGCIPELTGWSAGAAGLSPVVDTEHQRLLDGCDGILLVGWDPVELRDHWMPGWPDRADVIVIDEAAPIDLPCRVDELLVGSIPPTVAALTDALDGVSTTTLAEVDAHRARWLAPFDEAQFGPATAIRAVQQASDDAIVTLDVGAHRITASAVWRAERPDRLLQNNGLSSMGYGLPAALAAATLGHRAVAIVGDMGLQMTLGELGVAAEQGLDLVVVVLQDASLSLIELKQERRGGAPDPLRFGNPDWTGIATAFGGHGYEARDPRALRKAVHTGLATGGIHVIAACIDPSSYRSQM